MDTRRTTFFRDLLIIFILLLVLCNIFYAIFFTAHEGLDYPLSLPIYTSSTLLKAYKHNGISVILCLIIAHICDQSVFTRER